MVLDVASLRRNFPAFAVQPMPFHYLDNAATAQIHVAAIDAIVRHDTLCRGNVLRGQHRLAEAATSAYEQARSSVARFLNGQSDEIVFTSGATAAINLIAATIATRLAPGDEVVISRAEHHSNLLPWQRLQEQGVRLCIAPLTEDGRVDTEALGSMIGRRCRLVAITHASNVTGAITDISTLVDCAHSVGARVLIDGSQAAAHRQPDVLALGADFYVFSGHKVFGPTGIGVLWGRREALAELPPFMFGGGVVTRVGDNESSWQEPPRRFEAGTPPIAQAVGLSAVLDWLMVTDCRALEAHEARLSARMLDGLQRIDGLRLLGPTTTTNRLPVFSFSLGHLHPHDICQVADSRGVALRGGHHCAQPLLRHFGVNAAVRASLAPYNDESDVDAALDAIEESIRILT